MRFAIAAMARHGNDLIVDDVLLGRDTAEYGEALAGLTVHWVGVFAPLDVLEARERERKDRMIGLSRWQFNRVHRGIKYDLEIDTSEASPTECAQLIKQAFGL
jgi:chloramphenicol 3-O phosphotransferase